MQLAVGPDGEQAGVLRIAAEHIMQKRRAYPLVRGVEVGRAGQAMQQLHGAADLVAEIAGRVPGQRIEVAGSLANVIPAMLDQVGAKQRRRRQCRQQHEENDA